MSGSQSDLAHVRFISAGAGSGKTYHLTEELEQALSEGRMTPAAVIGTTFTVKAATELHDRVRTRLIRSGRPLLSEQMAQAVIGTVHSVCGRLLRRFAFELGLSPEINVASAEDGARLFDQALDEVLSADRVREMNLRAERLGLVGDQDGTSWQDHVRKIAEETRSNDIDPTALPTMGRESALRFLSYFPEATCDDEAREVLLAAVQEAIANIDLASDATKTTRGYVSQLRSAAAELRRDDCQWTLWISLSKRSPAKRSENCAIPVRDAASAYDRHLGFHADIRGYIEGVFAIAGEALAYFQALKTERGLVDYDDMEQLALRALGRSRRGGTSQRRGGSVARRRVPGHEPNAACAVYETRAACSRGGLRRRREAGHLRFPGKRPGARARHARCARRPWKQARCAR